MWIEDFLDELIEFIADCVNLWTCVLLFVIFSSIVLSLIIGIAAFLYPLMI